MMYSSRGAKIAFTAILALASWSCSDDDDPFNPSNLNFPALSALVQANFCVRDNATTGQTKTGSISTTDCDYNPGYYEAYVVKVPTTGPVTFTVDSNFDSYLTLMRIDSYTATTANVTVIETDDDDAGDLDARLTDLLDAGTNYVILVSGLDYQETGSYSLTIQ